MWGVCGVCAVCMGCVGGLCVGCGVCVCGVCGVWCVCVWCVYVWYVIEACRAGQREEVCCPYEHLLSPMKLQRSRRQVCILKEFRRELQVSYLRVYRLHHSCDDGDVDRDSS